MKTIEDCIREQINAHPFTMREVLNINTQEQLEAFTMMIYGAMTRYTLSRIKLKDENL